MYKFKFTSKEEKEKLFDGRTIVYYSKIVGCSKQYLTSVFTGYRGCGKQMAYCICKAINPEYEIDDLFERTK